MIYLLGDSHADEISSYLVKNKTTKKITLGSHGLGSLVESMPYSKYSSLELAKIENKFNELSKKSIIFLSYTEVDARIGMGEDDLDLYQIYKAGIDKIIKLSSPKKIIFLDWYLILNSKIPSQKNSPSKRVENRKKQISCLNQLSKKYPVVEVSTMMGDDRFENKEGFILNKSHMKDKCHLNMFNPGVKSVMLPIFNQFIDEGKDK